MVDNVLHNGQIGFLRYVSHMEAPCEKTCEHLTLQWAQVGHAHVDDDLSFCFKKKGRLAITNGGILLSKDGTKLKMEQCYQYLHGIDKRSKKQTFHLEVCGVANTDWACLHTGRVIDCEQIPLVYPVSTEPVFVALVKSWPAGTAVDL